jgi:hypothetical protein
MKGVGPNAKGFQTKKGIRRKALVKAEAFEGLSFY